MIAGGIGITPFRSMIRHAVDTAAGNAIILLYSNDTPDEIAFREELDSLAENNDWLTVIHTITGDSGSWSSRTGRIDADLIAEHAGRLDSPVYYVCGPPDMVKAMDEDFFRMNWIFPKPIDAAKNSAAIR
ncbi:MAG: FAD-dependent oxidoreductase [Gammaproteobacteria bacterium]|nr:FAD-dependent oxidoreductase [Gammaproteobacteria bacterium]